MLLSTQDMPARFGNRSCKIFMIEPVGKPRMTQSDKWKERPIVIQYRAYADELRAQALESGFKLGNRIDVVFHITMPASWSKKKKEMMDGKPHKSKPDTDNLLKAFCDALKLDDSDMWDMRGRKFWSTSGAVEVLVNNFDHTN